MKKAFYLMVLALLSAGTIFLTGCPNNKTDPTSPSMAPDSPTATPSDTTVATSIKTATATSTPTVTATATPPLPTATSTPRATLSNTPTRTFSPTATSTRILTATPSGTPTATASGTPTRTSSPTGTATSSRTPTGTPTASLSGTSTSIFTPTPTPTAAPVTVSVSIATSTLSSTGYIYTCASGTNGTGGLLTLSAHVGDTLHVIADSAHPLYLDGGSSTCIYTGATSSQSYTFPSAGTYYFHCGNHATGCGGSGNAACGSTSCSGMAGMVTVN